ncbi:MAG: hypothetical protein KC713_08485, partial [Candidatus Omnitrophica bacterium]|nr:hypothetical protein [Candidatus Omnitrophota bacterium]
EVLMNHFRLQTNELYEDLLLYYAGDHKTLKLIEFFRENLKQLKYQTIVFFDSYDIHKHQSLAGHFSAGLHVFMKEIEARVIAEEEYFISFLSKRHR